MTKKELLKAYEIPMHPKTGRPTTGGDELEIIFDKTGDRVVELALQIRSLDTMINNYIPNWEPKKDGRVHTTWGFTAPSGQINSYAPNVLNLSKHTKNGQIFRRMIEAPEGYSFIEFDKKSFHVATMGYAAEDATYVRFSQIDPHSIFASHICPRDWCKPITMDLPDGVILEQATWLKKKCKEVKAKDPEHTLDIRQDVAKTVVLANQLGQGYRNLYRKNRRVINGENQAKYLQDMLGDLFPKVKQFKEDIRHVAHGLGVGATRNQMDLKARFGGPRYLLLKEWGKIDYFFDVFSWRWTPSYGWKLSPGSDSEKSIAFPVQGYAFGMLKYEHRIMDERGWLDAYGFINSIHDSNVFLLRDNDSASCLQNIPMVMNAPCTKLVNKATGPEGLRVAVEATMGKNLQDWSESNPEGMKEVKI